MGSRIKLLILYIATSAVIYGGFWIGYCINFVFALVLAILLVVALAVLFAILRHKTWPAILCAMGLSLAIGLSLSAIFTGLKLPASRFLGLTLLIMVGYKGLQLFITYIIHNRILKNIINSLFVIAEIISIILVMTSKLDSPYVINYYLPVLKGFFILLESLLSLTAVKVHFGEQRQSAILSVLH